MKFIFMFTLLFLNVLKSNSAEFTFEVYGLEKTENFITQIFYAFPRYSRNRINFIF